MGKTTYKKIISLSLVLAVIASGAALYYGMKTAKYERYLMHMSERAYSEVISGLSNVSTALEKLKYAREGPYLNAVAAQIWREASMAKSGLSLLPLGDVKLDQTEKFIAQAGEYAYSILRRGRNDDMDGSIETLTQTANDLTQKLWLVKNRVNKGEVDFEHLDSQGSFSSSAISDHVSQVEAEFPQMGTLIYDGPFSDHLEKLHPAMLQDAAAVSADAALETAKSFTQNNTLTLVSEGGDKIPVYLFSGQDGTAVQVTKAGGYVLQMSRPATPGATTITPEEAIVKAKDFFHANGYPGMKQSYYTIFDHMITINFAYCENDISVYPDLIKIGVAMDTGNIVFFESHGYLMNHKSRTLPQPAINLETAKSKLHATLQIVRQNMAIIPTTGGKEVFCYEFLCQTPQEQKVLVYIAAHSAQEENMLVLIEDDSGTLTM